MTDGTSGPGVLVVGPSDGAPIGRVSLLLAAAAVSASQQRKAEHVSECGPDCDCDDAQRRRMNADISALMPNEKPSARRMNDAVSTYPSTSEPFTVETGPFRGRVYRINAAGQRVRQKHLERSARL